MRRTILYSIIALVAAATLTACGGGSDDDTPEAAGDATWTDGVLTDGTMSAAWFTDPDGNVLNIETDPRSDLGCVAAPPGRRSARPPSGPARQSSSISEPSGAMTYQTSLTPWPLTSPGAVSWANV